MTDWTAVRRGAAYTGATLMGGLVAGIAVGSAIDGLLSHRYLIPGRLLAGSAALCIMSAATYRWGRSLAVSLGDADPRRSGRFSAGFTGPALIAAGAGLAALEPIAVQRGGELGISVHGVYSILFGVATFLVSAVGSYGLGLGVRDHRFAVHLARVASPAAVAGFLVIAMLMYALGWRVGAPHAAERATMLVVTALGMTAAALASGAVIGHVLLAGSPGAPTPPPVAMPN